VHTVEQIISVVTVRTADYTAAVVFADVSEMLRGASFTGWSVAISMEVDEGRWGRSAGQVGSMKVRCKSAWLLHLGAALAIRSAFAT